jgi:hypothetical protein
MKVLVIGGGGREHALAWKLSQCERVQTVFVAPGNGGTASDPALRNVPITEPAALADFAAREKVALTVVGPEAPLAAGVVDLFRERGLRIFGPTRAAAQLESSKAFSKAFMQRHRIPTARAQTFADPVPAHAYVDAEGAPIVIKADGLAAGKGVVVAMTLAEAHAAIDDMLGANTLGVLHNADGARVVIEEFMAGEEASFIVIADGTQVLALATSQDHKRVGDGDTGPNTGGMGAYSPAPVVTPNVHAKVMQDIIGPTLAGMAREGMPFSGFLYAGLMIDAQGRAAHGRIQLPPGRPRGAGHPDAAEERPVRGADARHRRHAGQRRTALGPPHRAGRGDGRRRLPGRAAQGRRRQRRAAAGRGPEGLPRRHHAGRRPVAHQRRPRAVRHRAGRLGAAGAAARLRRRAQPAFRRRPVPQRHRPPRHQALSPMNIQPVRDYLLGLQHRIVSTLQAEDGKTFISDGWTRPAGGRCRATACRSWSKKGNLLERGGCNFSHVKGTTLPPSATQHRPELAGAPFEAMGVSLVMHPRSPQVPTVHMNVRMFAALPEGKDPVVWFGGGMDLTPYYGVEEDARTSTAPAATRWRRSVPTCTRASRPGATSTSS